MTLSSASSKQHEVRVIEISEALQANLITDTSISDLKDKPNTAFIRTTYTSVSPGTELLVFQGDLPEDEDEDVNKTYPYRYGYSAVGIITHLNRGEEDEEDDLNVGDRVFVFREHASHFSQCIKDVRKIPNDVSDIEAVLLPAVETALSIIFDTHPLPGDDICIIGQGLIGLLICKMLSITNSSSNIITQDLSQTRRDLSERVAKADLCIQGNLTRDEKFDCIEEKFRFQQDEYEGVDICIEVSGTGSGLNNSLDITRKYGKVVLGSWYGNKPVVLPIMGSKRFHRSHIEIVTSQVSEFNEKRWDKERRFKLCWKLLQQMQPVSTFDIPVFNPTECQNVYEMLKKREIISAVFKWS